MKPSQSYHKKAKNEPKDQIHKYCPFVKAKIFNSRIIKASDKYPKANCATAGKVQDRTRQKTEKIKIVYRTNTII